MREPPTYLHPNHANPDRPVHKNQKHSIQLERSNRSPRGTFCLCCAPTTKT